MGLFKAEETLEKHPIFVPLVQGEPEVLFGSFIDFSDLEDDFRKAELARLKKHLNAHLQSGNEELQIELGVTLQLLGENKEALKHLDSAEQQLPENPLAPYALARMIMESDSAPAAQTTEQESRWSIIVGHLREVLRLDSQNIPAHYHLGNAIRKLVEEESFVDAVEVYTEYLEQGAPLGHAEDVQSFINEQDPVKQREAAFLAAKTAYEAGDFQKSIAASTKAAALGNNRAYYYLGKAYEDTHAYANAVEAYRKAVRVDPEKRKEAYRAYGYTVLKLLTANPLLREGLTALTLSDPETSYATEEVDRLQGIGSEIADLLRQAEHSNSGYALVLHNDKWYVDCGALHGLPVMNTPGKDVGKPIPLKILRRQHRELLGGAYLETVGIFKCQVKLTEELFKIIAPKWGNKNEFSEEDYIVEFPPFERNNFYVDLQTSDSMIALLAHQWAEKTHPHDIDLSALDILVPINREEQQRTDVRIVNDAGRYQILDVARERSWLEHPLEMNNRFSEEQVVGMIKNYLQKIAHWSRFLKLTNKHSPIKDGFQLDILTMDYAQWKASGEVEVQHTGDFFKAAQAHEKSRVQLVVPKDAFISRYNGQEMGVPVRGDAVLLGLRLKSFRANLFYYLYDFNRDARITLLRELPLEQPTAEKGVALFGPIPFFLDDDDESFTVWLKLLVTNEPLRDSDILTQQGLNALKRRAKNDSFMHPLEDWYLETLEITIARQT